VGASTHVIWPELYIIGAPKCGTTALAAYLADHPQVSFSSPKEPHFFATDFPGQRLAVSERDYLRMFPDKKVRPAIRAEGSVWYLYSREAVPNILSVRPDAKFVVMLRNPIDAAYALHGQKLNSLDEDIVDFERAFRLQHKRKRGEAVPATCRVPSTILYGEACKYGDQLERLFGLVERDRVKVIVFEHFSDETRRVYQETLALVGLPDDGRVQFPRVNEGSRTRSAALNTLSRRPSALRRRLTQPIKDVLGVRRLGVSAVVKRLNRVKTRRPPLPSKTRDELAAYFAADVQKLSGLLQLDLTPWVSSRPDAAARDSAVSW
jgi:hypothetical protein